jgi:hypothetical protein
MTDPVDSETWRTFDWADVKKFEWDACREVATKETYNDPWSFQDFLMASKRKAFKSDDMTTVDSFFNDNNIYRPFIEEIIKGVVFLGFFSKQDENAELENAVFMPTQKIRGYASVLRHFQDGELDKIEGFKIPS